MLRHEVRRRTDWEGLIGRGLAICVHPYAAWRTHPKKARAFVVFAYAAAGYVLLLGLLLLVSPAAP